MDLTPWISAGLGAFGVIAVQFLKNAASKQEHNVDVALHKQEQDNIHKIIMTRLDAIERKLDIHNGYAEKFADTSNAITAIQKDIEYLKKGRK